MSRSGAPALTPLGAARQRFLARRRSGSSTGDEAFPAALVAAAGDCDLGEEMVYLAWELARAAPGLAPAQRRAWMRILLASLLSLREGSTRLPLGASSDGERSGYLDQLLSRLGADARERAAAAALLSSVAAARRAGVAGPLDALVGAPGQHRPLILDGDFLYHQRMLHSEERLVEALRARLDRSPRTLPVAEVNAALDDVLARPSRPGGVALRLSEEQREAVALALRSPLSVISGGPGTGKTSIVVSILRALVRLGVRIEAVALAAPTGKAANRLEESIRRSLLAVDAPGSLAPADQAILDGCSAPRTLHRLLGYSPSREQFIHHENNQLAEEVVIIDECSMIDLFLMDRLVRSVRAGAQLILLGDADQLPSVDAGAVFRDLLPRRALSTVAAVETASPGARGSALAHAAIRLTRSFRMDPSDPAGRNVYRVAQAINAGGSDARAIAESLFSGADAITRRAHAAELAFAKTELLEGPPLETRRAFLERWFADQVRGLAGFERLTRKVYRRRGDGFDENDRHDLDVLFRHFDRFRLLCITRGTSRPTGAGALNLRFHEMVLDGASDGGETLRAAPRFFPGEPVMMQRNDYERGLYNGDQGLILRVAAGGTLDGAAATAAEGHHFMAVFPRGDDFIAFHLDTLRDQLELCFAMTVHKAQGSEFDRVAILLPDEDLPLLGRELLYTAVTRSRRSVVFVGTAEVLVRGVERAIRRYSGVTEKLEKSV